MGSDAFVALFAILFILVLIAAFAMVVIVSIALMGLGAVLVCLPGFVAGVVFYRRLIRAGESKEVAEKRSFALGGLVIVATLVCLGVVYIAAPDMFHTDREALFQLSLGLLLVIGTFLLRLIGVVLALAGPAFLGYFVFDRVFRMVRAALGFEGDKDTRTPGYVGAAVVAPVLVFLFYRGAWSGGVLDWGESYGSLMLEILVLFPVYVALAAIAQDYFEKR